MGQIVQVKTGQNQIVLGKVLTPAEDKFVVSDDQFDKLSADAFTATLTDLGPSILVTAPVALSGITEANKVLATFTPGFAGTIRSMCAVVTVAATTASKAAEIVAYVDQDSGTSQVTTLTITGGPTGGNYKVAINGGAETANVAHNATGATLQTAVEALSYIAAGDVTITGGAGGPYVMTFGGALADQDVTVTTSETFSGGTAEAITPEVTTPAVAGAVATSVLGAVVDLTSTNATPAGKVVPGTNITKSAANPAVFAADAKITIRSGEAPTAFSEGSALFMLLIDPALAA